MTFEDVETLRGPSELPHHWTLRRQFLLAHKDKFPLDRLICLSNVFVNVECMGVKYNPDLMKNVEDLGKNLDKSAVRWTPVSANEHRAPRRFHQRAHR